MRASQVIKQLAHEINIPELEFGLNKVCLYKIPEKGDLTVSFETNESEEVLFVCAKIGVMPDDDNIAAAVSLLFVQANMELSVKDKGVLVVDFDSEGLLLVKYYDLHYWKVNECASSIMQYVDEAVFWRSKLQTPDFGLEGVVINNEDFSNNNLMA